VHNKATGVDSTKDTLSVVPLARTLGQLAKKSDSPSAPPFLHLLFHPKHHQVRPNSREPVPGIVSETGEPLSAQLGDPKLHMNETYSKIVGEAAPQTSWKAWLVGKSDSRLCPSQATTK
jgi:hypothetical protein